MPNPLTQSELRRLARLGAEARLAQLDVERQAILQMFPDLAKGMPRRRPGRPPTADAGPSVGPATADVKRRRRKRMTAAARKAASERMKKYWAERRKAEV